jgi:hypothetical protein
VRPRRRCIVSLEARGHEQEAAAGPSSVTRRREKSVDEMFLPPAIVLGQLEVEEQPKRVF